MNPDTPLGAAEVAHYFHAILGRPPEDQAVVQHYVAMGMSAAAFVRVLMDSEEVSERYRRRVALAGLAESGRAALWPERQDAARRVLLFGAYGNGNLGDAVQAEALAFLLQRLLPGPLSLAASSWERRAPYAFAAGVRLAADALVRGELLPDGRRDGLVVIGGGGVLGAPHFPLHARSWAAWFAGRGVPWALLGVGGSAEALAEPAWTEAYRILIERAAFVGVRDAETLAAARVINPQATWFPDPVLARAVLETEALSPRGALAPDPGEWAARPLDVLIIPRHPNSAADATAGRAALRWRAELVAAGSRVAVAAMERDLDAATLAGEDAIYVDDWAVLMALCRRARVVVSLRLHGVIAGIAAGCVVHGLVQPKIGDLMAGLGIADWFSAASWPYPAPDLALDAAAPFRDALAPGIARLRHQLGAVMQQAGRALAAGTRGGPGRG